MSRRSAKMHAIYRRWAVNKHMRWIPPYGWISKIWAHGLSYRFLADQREIESQRIPFSRHIGKLPELAMGYDPGAPGGDHVTIAFRKGDMAEFIEPPVITEDIYKIIADRIAAYRDSIDKFTMAAFYGENPEEKKS